MSTTRVGAVTHYYGKISVAVANLSGPLQLGDMISIVGKHTDLQQKVESMQIDHQDIQRAKAGQEIALRVTGRVREGDAIYRTA
ncbi:MAG: translation elongation factor-like protein [Bacillota bacterium]|nr:translation elongation factor-like protein [Bacillota bacterium]